MNIDTRIKNLLSKSSDPLSDKIDKLLNRRSIRNTAASAGSRSLNLMMARKSWHQWYDNRSRQEGERMLREAMGLDIDRNNGRRRRRR